MSANDAVKTPTSSAARGAGIATSRSPAAMAALVSVSARSGRTNRRTSSDSSSSNSSSPPPPISATSPASRSPSANSSVSGNTTPTDQPVPGKGVK